MSTAQPVVGYRDAEPADAEHIARLYDRVYSGGYPVTDFMDPAAVRALVTAGADVWQVATLDGQVIGSLVGEYAAWNRSYEICRAVMDPDFARGGRFGPLFESVQRACIRRPDCELLPGYARSDHMQHLCEVVHSPYAMLGSDGGMHQVSGVREEHLVVLASNPLRQVRRITPPVPFLVPGGELDRRIAPLGLGGRRGPYPAATVVGPGGEHGFECDAGRVTYDYFEPSGCAVVCAVEAGGPAEAAQCLARLIAAQPHRIEHLTVHVLADKHDLIARLCATLGFAVTAYVPAWYAAGDERYDCAWLTARFDRRTAIRIGTDALIRSLLTDLGAASAQLLRRSGHATPLAA